MEKLPTCSVMSKKRYNEIRELVLTVTGDEVKTEEFMRGVAEVMKYDPERGLYTPEKGKRSYESQKRRAALKNESKEMNVML